MTECSLCDQKKEECFCQNYWHTFEDDLLDIKFFNLRTPKKFQFILLVQYPTF